MTDTRTVCINGTWYRAHWSLSAVDLDTGAVSLTCAVPAAHTALTVRLDMATVQRLRAEAGFTGPVPAANDSYDCRTIDQRLTELERSHRLLDDRDINSATELRQQLDFTAGDVRRLTGALQVTLKRVAALEGKEVR